MHARASAYLAGPCGTVVGRRVVVLYVSAWSTRPPGTSTSLSVALVARSCRAPAVRTSSCLKNTSAASGAADHRDTRRTLGVAADGGAVAGGAVVARVVGLASVAGDGDAAAAGAVAWGIGSAEVAGDGGAAAGDAVAAGGVASAGPSLCAWSSASIAVTIARSRPPEPSSGSVIHRILRGGVGAAPPAEPPPSTRRSYVQPSCRTSLRTATSVHVGANPGLVVRRLRYLDTPGWVSIRVATLCRKRSAATVHAGGVRS
jgi:hypothetical protein